MLWQRQNSKFVLTNKKTGAFNGQWELFKYLKINDLAQSTRFKYKMHVHQNIMLNYFEIVFFYDSYDSFVYIQCYNELVFFLHFTRFVCSIRFRNLCVYRSIVYIFLLWFYYFSLIRHVVLPVRYRNGRCQTKLLKGSIWNRGIWPKKMQT